MPTTSRPCATSSLMHVRPDPPSPITHTSALTSVSTRGKSRHAESSHTGSAEIIVAGARHGGGSVLQLPPPHRLKSITGVLRNSRSRIDLALRNREQRLAGGQSHYRDCATRSHQVGPAIPFESELETPLTRNRRKHVCLSSISSRLSSESSTNAELVVLGHRLWKPVEIRKCFSPNQNHFSESNHVNVLITDRRGPLG